MCTLDTYLLSYYHLPLQGRERDIDTGRKTGRQRETKRERETDRPAERDRDSERERERTTRSYWTEN